MCIHHTHTPPTRAHLVAGQCADRAAVWVALRRTQAHVWQICDSQSTLAEAKAYGGLGIAQLGPD